MDTSLLKGGKDRKFNRTRPSLTQESVLKSSAFPDVAI